MVHTILIVGAAAGEMACVVWNSAFKLTEHTLNLVGMVPELTAAKWAGKVLKIGNRLLAQGSKMGSCPNVFCAEDFEEGFTVIDMDRIEDELGMMSVC